MSARLEDHCYLCGVRLQDSKASLGQEPASNKRTVDHVPPAGLFPSPKPDNLIVVPCCFSCNNRHSGFDERLRIAATMPFDRNDAGQAIFEKKVMGGTLVKGRQIEFFGKLLSSMRPVNERPELVHVRSKAHEFDEGMVRITKGLLFGLHPQFDYRNSIFQVISLHPRPHDAQTRVIAMLKQAQYLERGQKVFQVWRHVDESRQSGAWMLVFYECFGFFVTHMPDGSRTTSSTTPSR